MAKLFLDVNRALAGAQKQAGERVPDIMHAHFPQAGLLQNPLEMVAGAILRDGQAALVED
nr:hypothetical protein [Desulfarculus baarsii]